MRSTIVRCVALSATFAAAACGGMKKEEKPAEPAAVAAAAVQDSIVKDSITKDSIAKAGGMAKSKGADTLLRDSAFGPKFTVDSTGKVTPIKPPAKKP